MKAKIKKHKKLIIILCIIIVLAVAITVAVKMLGNNTVTKVHRQSTVSLTKQDLVTSISATGTIESNKTKNISAQMQNATVKKVHVSVGDTVSKGDVLITFDESDLQDAVDEAQDNLSDVKTENQKNISKAQKQLSEAKSDYEEQKSEIAEKVADAKSDYTKAKKNLSN